MKKIIAGLMLLVSMHANSEIPSGYGSEMTRGYAHAGFKAMAECALLLDWAAPLTAEDDDFPVEATLLLIDAQERYELTAFIFATEWSKIVYDKVDVDIINQELFEPLKAHIRTLTPEVIEERINECTSAYIELVEAGGK